jgi:hypothetical protein
MLPRQVQALTFHGDDFDRFHYAGLAHRSGKHVSACMEHFAVTDTS